MGTGARRLGEHAALSDDDNVLARELLLELTDQLLADLLEGLELGNRNKENDGALVLADLDLVGKRVSKMRKKGKQNEKQMKEKQNERKASRARVKATRDVPPWRP